MKTKLLTTALLSTIAMSSQAAVSLSQTNQGDMVILPYYTVKNNMNTAFTVTNHSSTQGKVVSVAYKESKNNQDVLFYNVLLKPNSSWAVGLGAIQSTIPQHNGEPSVVQIYDSFNSTQCAPFVTPQQEFLPYAYEEDESSNLSLERAQEGHIEIYEVGSFDPSLDNDDDNIDLTDCGVLSGQLSGDQLMLLPYLLPATGEISATASLLNVNEGASYAYNGVAFNGFSDSETFNFETFPFHYDFNDASTSAVIVQNGVAQTTQWNSGAEAINALISSYKFGTDFTVEAGNNSQTEVVFSLPGKIFMNSGNEATAPFTQTYDSTNGSCETAGFAAYDRNGEIVSAVDSIDLCWGTNVLKVDAQSPSALSDVLMSQHQIGITPSGDSGRLAFSFDHTMHSLNGYEIKGLPVLGFTVQRYTNANAAPGLMAQYGSLFQFSSTKMASDQ